MTYRLDMASTASTPPSGTSRMYLTVIWLETILYGLNCMLFGTCVYVFISRRRRVHWMLCFSSAFLFSLATVHVIISFVQMLRAFTDPAITSIPDGSDEQFSNHSLPLPVAGEEVYFVITATQDLLLIWRFYVVSSHRWEWCILPLLAEFIGLSCAIASSVLSIEAAGSSSYKSKTLIVVGWIINLMLNGGLTCAIAWRLWLMGKRASSAAGAYYRNSYTSAIVAVVESGALFTAAVLVVICLNFTHNNAVLASINFLAQLGTTTPLLIVFHLGFYPTRGDPSGDTTIVKGSERVISLSPLAAHGDPSNAHRVRSNEDIDDIQMHSFSECSKRIEVSVQQETLTV